jgi:putative SOS response-associated peptidase YedK
MTDANKAIAPLHDRMPVFLFENEWDKWMAGSFDDLLAF